MRSSRSAPTALWVAYAVMCALLIAYIASLVIRSPSDQWPWVDGWGVCIYELIVVGMLFARAFSKQPGRAVAIVLGSAVLAWALGDVVLTWETWTGAAAPVPSLADVFYVSFYPLAYAAIVLMLRK
jgi:hypothetical protein